MAGIDRGRAVIRMVIPMASPSLNQTQRMHWAELRKLAKTWQVHIFVRAFEVRAEPASSKRRVVIERRGKRQLDKDNAYGGCKIIVDALKKEGLIVDDDSQNLDLEVTQAKLSKGDKPCTVITITDSVGP